MAKILGKFATRCKRVFSQILPKSRQPEFALTIGSEIGHPARETPIILFQKFLAILSK